MLRVYCCIWSVAEWRERVLNQEAKPKKGEEKNLELEEDEGGERGSGEERRKFDGGHEEKRRVGNC